LETVNNVLKSSNAHLQFLEDHFRELAVKERIKRLAIKVTGNMGYYN
jgi:hypothetical protein